jgi:hypothetical protein
MVLLSRDRPRTRAMLGQWRETRPAIRGTIEGHPK